MAGASATSKIHEKPRLLSADALELEVLWWESALWWESMPPFHLAYFFGKIPSSGFHQDFGILVGVSKYARTSGEYLLSIDI